jgi:adenylate cyclase
MKRKWWRPLRPLGDRQSRAVAAEEEAGRALAFRARGVAVGVVILCLPLLSAPPRLWYYIAAAALFFVLGLVPHLTRRSRHAAVIQALFVTLDAALITTVVIMPPPGGLDVGWPVQTRLRSSEFLYLIVLLAGAALSYSPWQVIWTGISIIGTWSAGVAAVFLRADTLTFADVAGRLDTMPVRSALEIYMDPYFVSDTTLLNQVILTALATGVLAVAVRRSRSMLLRHTRAEIARSSLARYVSPDLADAILTSEQRFDRPATREVAVLFADIVGFTTLSERTPPERIVTLLKSFHERCCRVVFRHGGSLDKYVGDGFLATFGAIGDMPDAAARAVRCAIELQQEVNRWNAKRAGRGAVAIPLSIGLHHGPAVVGNTGTEERLEFTVIGDTVNIASRLESLTRDIGCRIAVSAACLAAAKVAGGELPALRHLGPVPVRGRVEPVDVHVWPAAVESR